MKRRAISFITVLALCLSLCPAWVLAADWGPGDANTPMAIAAPPIGRTEITEDETYNSAVPIGLPHRYNTNGHTVTVRNTTAMIVESTGGVYLTYGTIESKNGSGIEVQEGSFLRVDDSRMTVIGTAYGLDISSGTDVQLSGGTFIGKEAAIKAKDYAALLVYGCAFFDENDDPIPLTEVSDYKTVKVKECTHTDHVREYEPDPDLAMHDWTCLACGKTDFERCKFDFGDSGYGECLGCERGIKIDIGIDEGSLVYDGNPKPDSKDGIVEVILDCESDGGRELEKDIDYEVKFTSGTNAGDIISIIVSGITYRGSDFVKTFEIKKDKPEIEWTAEQLEVNYTADTEALLSKIADALLQNLEIAVKASGKDLSKYIQFSYKNRGNSDANYIDGLPTNAGTYEIKAILPVQKNYKAASSTNTIILKISQINPDVEPPIATKPTYNGTVQNLVTSGSAPDGAEIQFAESRDGPWSKDIPTGINAGDYIVWYRVIDEDNNYIAVEATLINSVKIKRKEITPVVELEYYTCVYDGGDKEPKVTVRDKDDYRNPLPGTEYEVKYENNQKVGQATVTVSDKDKGNYKIIETTVNFEITAADQAGLSITGQPNTVTYGDVFTLGTSGGSGEGKVTWTILSGSTAAEIDDPTRGQIRVTGVGPVTVQAEKFDGDLNHKAATAIWSFTADPKHVTATVTADNKTYDGTNSVNIVSVEVGNKVSPDDIITITGVTGTFDDVNAGTGKTVTLNTSSAIVRDDGKKLGDTGDARNTKYIVTIPTTTTADINKAATAIETLPTSTAPTYNEEPQNLIHAATAKSTTTVTGGEAVVVEYALSESGPYSTVIPKATNAGSYEVWYRVRETGNYFGTAAESVPVTIHKKQVNAVVTLSENNYVYDGTEKRPAVKVTEADVSGAEIPSTEYTVAYSDNVNVGTATVTVTAKADGNYTFTNSPEKKTFSITQGDKAVLTSSPQAKDLTYNGQEQELVTVGTATGGTVVYSLDRDSGYDTEIPQKKDAGTYTVYYKVKADGNHQDSDVYSVSVTIKPKTVTSPVITLENSNAPYSVPYTGQKQEPGVTSVEDDGVAIPNAEYTVTYSNNINAGTATVHIVDNNGGNYDVSGSKTFEITKATAKFADGKEPQPQPNLKYNAKAQPLITAGVAEGGTAVYWLEDGAYSTAIPTGTDSGTYKVYAKVQGDANHMDSDVTGAITVEIKKNTVSNPHIELSSNQFRYNGSEQKPTVTVRDDKWNVIPANEYTVTYGGDTINVGTYTITVTSNGINYIFAPEASASLQATVTIVAADQEPLEITGKPSIVYYGDTFQLGTTGGSGNGTVTWSVEPGSNIATIDGSTGQVNITGVGDITIKASRAAGNNYAAAETTWTFHAYEKPVTAVVTAANKVYDGTRDATLTVTVPGTGITINVTDDYKGTFDSPDVGTSKTVTFENISSKVTVTNGNNYEITYPATTTASITPADVTLAAGGSVTNSDKPSAKSLTYDGSLQPLVTEGTSLTGGSWAYSVDGVSYSLTVPKAKDAGTYTVWYKVLADSNHKDTVPVPLTVTIEKKSVSVTVKCSPETFPYDGTEKTPNVVVTYNDGDEKVIPASEYTVEYPQSRFAVNDNYTVEVTSKGNYKFTGTTSATFKIVPADQAPLSIVTDKGPKVYFGDTFRLSAIGGTGNGKIVWTSDSENVATIDPDTGVVTVKGIGDFKITAYRKGTDGGYKDSNEDSITFTAEKKPVTAVVTAANKVYNGNNTADLTVTVPGTSIKISNVSGTFNDENVGANKTVTIDYSQKAVTGNDNYEVTYPATTTASITPAPTSLNEITVEGVLGLKYNGTPQALVTATGTPTGGSLAYSLDGFSYSLAAPTGKDAGEYTVWYKVRGDSNHADSEAQSVKVTIDKATPKIASNPTASSLTVGQLLKNSKLTGGQAMFDGVEVSGTFTWANGEVTFTEAGEYDVKFNPYDKTNYRSSMTKVEVNVKEAETNPTPTPGPDTDSGSGSSTGGGGGDTSDRTNTQGQPGTASASPQVSVKDGTASAAVNSAAGNQLVNDAIANQSENIVIKPEITGDVNKTEVSIPASAVSRISSETNAALTVSTPVADVIIPNASLDALSSAGRTVSVETERSENTVVLTLTSDGKDIGNIPGGLTLTVPVEDAGPGTVAVIVYKDGTRETVRWSVAEDGALRIPLNGSVTVEIVDNSKEFADVPAESWAADAVAFASAHELFNGTGEATFSPDQSMSRAMLATVLYNLEGALDQELTGEFSDVNSDDWYASGISWAAANGITSGYGDGQFGPNDDITREQLAVMLWRYTGSPAADAQVLNFADTDQASGYAMEALYWAAASGILNGYDGHLDPCGLATRAQAAQMLKNFIENM